MKKNTGCSCGRTDHHECPPQPVGAEAKSKSLHCESEQFAEVGALEETVVLGDVLIQTLTEADFHLPTYASAIKHIEKNVRLTQCKALPVPGNPFFVKLFIEGFVHKNIQFVEDGYGVVKDFSIDVPFRCFQQVELANPVVFPFGEFSVKSNVLQRRELAKDGMGADRCNFGSLTFEINNEPIKCKLLASAVNQWDITHNFDSYGRFNQITEKMEIILVIKLTQKQQDPEPVIPTLPPGDGTTPTPLNVYERFRQITGN